MTNYEVAVDRRVRRTLSQPSRIGAIAGSWSHRRWKINPAHPGLKFKKLPGTDSFYSIRVGLDWRVVGLFEGDTITWFWIGSHAEYDRLIESL